MPSSLTSSGTGLKTLSSNISELIKQNHELDAKFEVLIEKFKELAQKVDIIENS